MIKMVKMMVMSILSGARVSDNITSTFPTRNLDEDSFDVSIFAYFNPFSSSYKRKFLYNIKEMKGQSPYQMARGPSKIPKT